MANIDKHMEYGTSTTVSSSSKEQTPDGSTRGALVDSGFETYDLIDSPSQTSSITEQSMQNGKLSPDLNPFYDLETIDRDDLPLTESVEKTLMELDFFDPLAPLPEEFPSPQDSSSPQDIPSSPSKDPFGSLDPEFTTTDDLLSFKESHSSPAKDAFTMEQDAENPSQIPSNHFFDQQDEDEPPSSPSNAFFEVHDESPSPTKDPFFEQQEHSQQQPLEGFPACKDTFPFEPLVEVPSPPESLDEPQDLRDSLSDSTPEIPPPEEDDDDDRSGSQELLDSLSPRRPSVESEEDDGKGNEAVTEPSPVSPEHQSSRTDGASLSLPEDARSSSPESDSLADEEHVAIHSFVSMHETLSFMHDSGSENDDQNNYDFTDDCDNRRRLINKKKKKTETFTSTEKIDLKVKRSKSDVLKIRRTSEEEKENVLAKKTVAAPTPAPAAPTTITKGKIAPVPAAKNKNMPAAPPVVPPPSSIADSDSSSRSYSYPEHETTEDNQDDADSLQPDTDQPPPQADSTELTPSNCAEKPGAEIESTMPVKETAETKISIEELKSSYNAQIIKSSENPDSKETIETGVSIKALTTTYSEKIEDESSKPKESIATGVSIKELKSTYLQNGHLEKEEEKSPEKEIISTGIDIKSLKASYCELAKSEDVPNLREPKEKIETGISIKALRASYGDLTKLNETSYSPPVYTKRSQRARSYGDISKIEAICSMEDEIPSSISVQNLRAKSHNDLSTLDDTDRGSREEIHTGVSVKSLRASYCDLVKLDDSKSKNRETVQTGVSIKSLKSSFSSADGLDESPGVKIDRAKITRSFSQDVYPLYALLDAHDRTSARDEKSSLCRICGQQVFLMDRIKAEKGVFHKSCFRCKECGKQLHVDNYSSHEGIPYCKAHFKQLFQPKAKFEDDVPIFPRKRHEMIIKESVPVELPPDVVRSSDKPDYGLDELPSLRNIKSRFESSDQDSDLVRSPSSVSVKRSESILSRMAKFQSLGNENGHYDDSSSSEDEEVRDPDVIRETKKKEKLLVEQQESSQEVVFSGMTDLKSQWETGNLKSKEEWAREKQEELNKLRQRICHGKGNLKAMYENAVQESEKSSQRENVLDGEIREVCASSIKDKFEHGEVLSEAEREKLEKFIKEKEEDLSVFKESGTPHEARSLFKKIDETVKSSGGPMTPKKSPSVERSKTFNNLYYSQNSVDTEIVRANEPRKEEVVIDATDLSEKFKFFENYQDQAKQERKRFTMTPPREVQRDESPDREVARDPNIVRACDQEEEIIVTDTAKKMLNKFRELETQAEKEESPQGPKPMKRITPPREFTTYSDHESSPEPERNPDIVRCTDKVEDTQLIEAEKTRSLRAKFERWEGNDVDRENMKNIQEEIQPSIDTTKNLKAKFEALKEETIKPKERASPKVNRFVDYTSTGAEQCALCGKRVYAMEKIEASGHKFHKGCFKCAQCSCVLRLDNFTTSEGVLYCVPHFKQLFITKGNYDEGFGREQHKEKWNRSRSTTPTPHEFNGHNGSGDYVANGETEEIFA